VVQIPLLRQASSLGGCHAKRETGPHLRSLLRRHRWRNERGRSLHPGRPSEGSDPQELLRRSDVAVLVSGVSRKSAESITNRSTALGFAWDPLDLAAWPDDRWAGFLGKLFPDGQRPRSAKKWGVLRTIAKEVARFADETTFQAAFFDGKAKGSDLNGDDIKRISDKWLPFIRQTNAQYIVRNMGGESIKYDRWLNELVRYLAVSTTDLETALKAAGLSLSLFDVVVWAYCEAKVQRVAEFATHFDALLT